VRLFDELTKETTNANKTHDVTSSFTLAVNAAIPTGDRITSSSDKIRARTGKA